MSNRIKAASLPQSFSAVPQQHLRPQVLETAQLELLLQSRPSVMPDASRQQVRAAARAMAKTTVKVLRKAQRRKAAATYPAGIKPVLSNKVSSIEGMSNRRRR